MNKKDSKINSLKASYISNEEGIMNDVFYSDSNIPPPDYQTLEDQRLDTEQRVHRVNSDLFLSTEEKYREIVNKHENNIR